MELQFFGGNCFKLASKKVTFVIDDNLADLGKKKVTKDGEIMIFTHDVQSASDNFTIASPGQYEIAGISIIGVAARAHTEPEGDRSATMYRINAEGVSIGVLGHIYPDLSDAQMEALGMIDVLIIPVGGYGYTMDAVEARRMISKIEPKLVIPSHYADASLKYPVPQMPLQDVLTELALPNEQQEKLKLKPEVFGDLRLVVLSAD